MKPYGLKRQDRARCSIKKCNCGDMSSKHPRQKVTGKSRKNRRLKKYARRLSISQL